MFLNQFFVMNPMVLSILAKNEVVLKLFSILGLFLGLRINNHAHPSNHFNCLRLMLIRSLFYTKVTLLTLLDALDEYHS